MRKIKIKNVGPIEHADFELKKVNVFMGPQSSGKSTIAKIISYCQWVEKRFLLDGEFKYKVENELLEFHHLSENYFSEDSFFSYQSEFIDISYTGKDLEQFIKPKESDNVYKKSKNIYIPSERNFVSVIPNLSKYKETNDNIMNFVYDWYSAKRAYNKKNLLSVLNLEVSFYSKAESDVDTLLLQNDKEIQLREGSSGLQSIVPLLVLIEYLTEGIFEGKRAYSVDEYNKLSFPINKKLLDSIIQDDDSISIKDAFELAEKLFKSIGKYYFTNFIIEEPEQNLFPSTQRDLVNYLFDRMNDERPHSLLITTHSPYILYAINNCMMGYNIKENIEDYSELEDIQNQESWINPDEVAIWQVENGKLVSVKNEETKTVTKHYFNEITKDIMDEYYEMLSYFQHD